MTLIDDDRVVVYCAGPQHSPEELRGMARISSAIEGHGYRTYFSARDGLAGTTFEKDGMMYRAAYALEIYQLVQRCGALVLNMNGRVPDEGGVYSASLAFMIGKPVILYKNDNRSVFHGSDNPMITGLSPDSGVVRKLKRIPGALTRGLRKMETRRPQFPASQAPAASAIPEHVRRVADLGEQVWSHLQGIQMQGDCADGGRESNNTTDRLKAHIERMEALGSITL